MSESVQKPRIRFKGFSDAWEQRKVSEMFKVTRGYVLASTLTEAVKRIKSHIQSIPHRPKIMA